MSVAEEKRVVAKPQHGSKTKTISSNHAIISTSFVSISSYSFNYSSRIQKVKRKHDLIDENSISTTLVLVMWEVTRKRFSLKTGFKEPRSSSSRVANTFWYSGSSACIIVVRSAKKKLNDVVWAIEIMWWKETSCAILLFTTCINYTVSCGKYLIK